MSSYLDNLMRSGAQVFNAKVTVAGTIVTISSYDDVAYSSINPLLARFPSTQTAEHTGADLTIDFAAAAFGKADYDGNWAMFVGLLRKGPTEVVPTLSLTADGGVLTTSTTPSAHETFCSTTETGEVTIIARLMNVERINGAWQTTNAWVEG